MLKSILKFIFGDKQTRDVKRLTPLVKEINELFDKYQKLTDDEFRDQTTELFRRQLHVYTRQANAGGMLFIAEAAEGFLGSHPDVDRCVFVPHRRDMHPGKVSVVVKLKAQSKPSADTALTIREGMARIGPGYRPASVIFIDKLPMIHPEGERHERPDYHQLQRVFAELELPEWQEAKWAELSSRLKEEEEPFTLEDLTPYAFAAVKDACRRNAGKKWMAGGNEITWNMVPFDVQLMGGLALTQRSIAEMGTGEGKTLTAIAPLYLYALAGKGAHLVTVNDYLAKRDSEWNAPIFGTLGMRVDCIDKSEPHSPQRRLAYLADVTYGTNNEFGFDYLRDNMSVEPGQLVQRDHWFAIVDEVDSVLIDEARTPLIIAGPVDRETHQYDRILPQIRELFNRQMILANRLVKEAEELLEKDKNSYEAGLKLLQVYKGVPKHTRYMKLRSDPDVQSLQTRVELDYLREKKMHEVENELYFVVDEKQREASLTEKGRQALSPDHPERFVLIDIVDEFAKIEQAGLDEEAREKAKAEKLAEHDKRAEELHAINQLLHAFALKQKDVDYVVEENKVVIVDEFTGRKMAGRRWSDGLHQAVEAKEGVKIEKETQTLATVTIQNYFRMYKHLAGMTGTAETEATEFAHTYMMDVVVVPPNRPTRRKDLDDVVFKTKREKFAAVLDEIERLHKMGLPILVGTVSVQVSETISRMLKARKLEHQVLNAKNHSQEAQIIANAGRPGTITIATNMAGRGTDIKIDPSIPVSLKDENNNDWPGGLQIIGTERHESRRIDRQLRGRSGRQGDPGTSRFFLSLEDDLIMWFGGDRISKWMTRLGMQEGEPIISPMVTASIERAQKKVEQVNQERRKRTLDFDNVMNKQRLAVYGLRRDLVLEADLRDVLLELFADTIGNEFAANWMDKEIGDANIKGFLDWLQRIVATENFAELGERSYSSADELVEACMERVVRAFDLKVKLLTPEVAWSIARHIALRTIDTDWQDHLLAIDDLREGIFLRGYAQRDPLVEYTRDATMMFNTMMLGVQKQIFERYFRAQIVSEENASGNRVMRMVYAKPEAAPTLAAQPGNEEGEPEMAAAPGGKRT